MDRNRLIELLTKRESGIITLPEARELNEHLKGDPDDSQLADLLGKTLKGHFHQQESVESTYLTKRLQKLHEQIRLEDNTANVVEKPKGSFKKMAWAVAAALVLALGSVAIYIQLTHSDPADHSKNILTTKKGSKSNLVLPDGTRVLLNSDTRLSYNQSFGKQAREVTLEGEAYFEVVKDAQHPFIVHTNAMDIKVLGTVFNVRAYHNEKNTQTTLLEGSVEVILNKRNERNLVVLKPHEKIVVNNHPGHEVPLKADEGPVADISVMTIKTNAEDSSILETDWTKNKLAFDQARYSEVFPELERWYGVTITVKDSAILTRKISGIYENESLSDVMESLKLATGFRYTIDGNNLKIYK
ncbi:FecR domain-containing protein [Niabella sp. W65]|jgi:ferric-dicitrate binding protein FerR (iron transport regulator)|nr:FecR domain-containing protein [Niabella sp. W65]MCH7363243.1 FecR domain-containing protein [Niabella sp. W65]ULT39171.1 FecR domain-containing protein [Niabella sp. I65]